MADLNLLREEIDKIDNEIRNKVADYLRANVILLKYSILLSKQKECILNGGII